ncbi:MAG: phosphoenolpyruvate synthase [Tessaracoccus sp.]|uniref:PEP/pyruvate-binding domain-containing protein n=1 Tax=Tessaracoccus sp. TaxID=1971211 RepID=UPI001EB426CD|nr:PEP/pyruvate-binding domain-containing protein [Tessaracoccus sp.]MBK7820721.1 phosphoenolpyruvate synthase [Tessaracoccus sp.]
MSWVTPLRDVTRHDIVTAGGKGANLGELVRAGFPVPDGFVVTTTAYNTFVRRAGIVDELKGSDGARLRALFDRAVPADLAEAIVDAYVGLSDGADAVVAVRSSATAEDLAGASFAGQQDTYLGVAGRDEVLDAVRRCWASLWTDRAISYRAKAGIDASGVSLAVVVQRLIDADAAGVLFTANPANGRRHEAVINAAWGLGEAVVGGEVTPDELVVDGDRVLTRTVADKAVHTVRDARGTHAEPLTDERRMASVLDDDHAVALVALGRDVERHFGAPQDIEWARADGVFWLTQSRPITALPAPTGPIPTTWPVARADGMYMRASIVEQLPDPLSPLFADLIRPAVRHSLARVLSRYFGEGALRDDDSDFPTVNGYGYYFYSSAGMRRLFRLAPKGMRTAFGDSEKNGVVLWREQGLPAYRRTVDEWSGRDVGELPAGELLRGASALVTAGADYYTYVQAVIPQAATPEIMFTRIYGATVLGTPGVDKPPALTFLLGFESAPIRAERSLYRFARWCRETPGVAEAVLAGSGERADGLPTLVRRLPPGHAAAFRRRLDEHLAQFGHLTYNLDVMQPVAADDPAPVLAALAYAVSGRAMDPDARLAHLASERRRAEAWLERNVGPVRRKILEGWLEKAHRLGPLREDALADVGLGWPAARRLLRELGTRLVASFLIEDADDVFWLTLDEAGRAATALDVGAATGASLGDAVAQRKETWRGQRLAAPPPGWLPEGGFYYRLFRRFMPSNEAEQKGDTLQGLGASAGQATGPARLLRGPEDFTKMRPGDVLVAPITTPAYTPFFAMASAVVTDVGGPLSHSSIVAREYGIPAVLGTGSATRRIHDDDQITVDGERGLVRLPQSPRG